MAGGRPTKYNEELQKKADEYVLNYQKQGDVIPSQSGLCVWLGIHRATLHEWDEIHQKFSDTLRHIKDLQENTTLNKGLTGEFNSTITKLVLANHGYTEKIQTDHTSSDGSHSTNSVLNALAEKFTTKNT